MNRLPTQYCKQSPYEILYGQLPDISDFHEFGSNVHVHIPDCQRKKLDFKSIKKIYLGHDDKAKGYRVYDPVKQTVSTTRDIIFIHSNQVPLTQSQAPNVPVNQAQNNQNSMFHDFLDVIEENRIQNPQQNPPIPQQVPNVVLNNAINQVTVPVQIPVQVQPPIPTQASQNDNVQNVVNPVPTRRSERVKQAPTWQNDYEMYKISEKSSYKEPKTFLQAVKSSESSEWIEAMNQELNSLDRNQTWQLVNRPSDKNVVGCKWVFKRKQDNQGNITEYKARLVAKGFSQVFGQDYDEVYAPVARSASFRLLLNIAARRNLLVHQFDIKSAFLNGSLEEEIYMEQPEGFKSSNQVCKLIKSIYGLKQAARSWNQAFHNVITN